MSTDVNNGNIKANNEGENEGHKTNQEQEQLYGDWLVAKCKSRNKTNKNTRLGK